MDAEQDQDRQPGQDRDHHPGAWLTRRQVPGRLPVPVSRTVPPVDVRAGRGGVPPRR